jgi:hypothetical protein
MLEHTIGARIAFAAVHSVAFLGKTIVSAVASCHGALALAGVLVEVSIGFLELIHLAIGNREVRHELLNIE